MNEQQIIQYAINTASQEQIEKHFTKCDETFFKVLSHKINIKEYALKIVENAVTFEAWANSQLVGFIAAYFNDDQNKSAFITNVSSIKEFTGKGIAQQLIKNCIAYAKTNNFRKIKLEVDKTNTGAVYLYEKYGFITLNEKNGSLIMKLIL